MNIKDIHINPNNPRYIKDERYQKLKKSIQEFPKMMKLRPIIIDDTGMILGGNMRYLAMIDLGYKEIPEGWVVKASELTEEERERFKILDNIPFGDWDYDILANEWELEKLQDWGIELPELENIDIESNEIEHIKLADKFIVPPFSILDTRQGYWQERKQAWLSLGIKSEMGRNETLLGFKSLQKKFGSRGGTDVETSIFDPVLCELIYRWFCPESGKILDPFAGGSVRGLVAGYLGYDYTGIELRPEQVEANKKQDICKDKKPIWIVGNSKDIDTLAKGEYDLIFSCPPYYDIEVYSDIEGELSVKSTYQEFIKSYKEIICKCIDMLKKDRFACFVVGDIRDKNGYYRNFVSDTISAFQDSGVSLYNEAILITSIGSLPIRVGRQFGSYRKLGKTHQNVLIFYRGNPKRIKDNYKEIEIVDLENQLTKR